MRGCFILCLFAENFQLCGYPFMDSEQRGFQNDHRYRNKSFASSFFVVSWMSSTSTFTVLVPNWISMTSPTLTFTEAFATLPFTRTRPASQASFATVRRLISRDTFKNLSSLISSSYGIKCAHPPEGFCIRWYTKSLHDLIMQALPHILIMNSQHPSKPCLL